MSFSMEAGIFLAYAAGLFLIYILGKFLIVPVKWAGKLLVNSLVGGVLIFIFNQIGGVYGLYVPLNPFTAIILGLLGIPGAICLLLYFNV